MGFIVIFYHTILDSIVRYDAFLDRGEILSYGWASRNGVGMAALASAVVPPFYLGTLVKATNSLNIISPKSLAQVVNRPDGSYYIAR